HEDRANVRCFDNKRRFGIDLLYPTQRYVDGLSKSMVVDSQTGQQVPNPLLTGRQPDLIFFAGIIGVPWQDIATDESRDDPTTLKYLSAEELAQYDESIDGNRWDLILGKPGLSNDEPACWSAEPPETCGLKPVPPKDPMMV